MRDDSRWLAVIHYRSEGGMVDVPHDIEEIEDLQGIVESGPDWRTIEKIEITLQRRVGTVRVLEDVL